MRVMNGARPNRRSNEVVRSLLPTPKRSSHVDESSRISQPPPEAAPFISDRGDRPRSIRLLQSSAGSHGEKWGKAYKPYPDAKEGERRDMTVARKENRGMSEAEGWVPRVRPCSHRMTWATISDGRTGSTDRRGSLAASTMERLSIGKTRASKLLNRQCQSGSNARAGVVEMRLAVEPDQNSVRSAPRPLSFSDPVIDKKVRIASSSLFSSTERDSFHLHPYTHRLTLRFSILDVYSHTLLLPRTDLFPQIYYNRHLSHSDPPPRNAARTRISTTARRSTS